MLTEEQIEFLNEVCPGSWTKNHDIINVHADLDINVPLYQMPVQFGQVEGHFNCVNNNLTTLIGSPTITWDAFSCVNNDITSLEGGPKEVGEDYSCSHNKLTNLVGAPKICLGIFNCSFNKLTTLEGGPEKVNTFYACTDNKLTNLIGAPEICNNDFLCYHNQLTSLEGCPRLIEGDLDAENNLELNILYGIGQVKKGVYYDNRNDLNEWIIEQARLNIFSTYEDISKWIKHNNKFEHLLHARQEIRQYFSPRIIHLVDSGAYNESKILDYKKFKKLC